MVKDEEGEPLAKLVSVIVKTIWVLCGVLLAVLHHGEGAVGPNFKKNPQDWIPFPRWVVRNGAEPQLVPSRWQIGKRYCLSEAP